MTAPKDRYSKVSRRLWTDSWFIGLGPCPCTPHTVWLALLTVLPTPVPGLAPVGVSWLAEQCGWKQSETAKAIKVLEAAGRVVSSRRPATIWLPNAIKHNQPANRNVGLGWGRECAAIPESPLRDRALPAMAAMIESATAREGFITGCGDAFVDCASDGIGNGSANGSPNGMPTQEQEQEQEQEHKNKAADAARSDSLSQLWAGYVEGRTHQSKKPGKGAKKQMLPRLKEGHLVEDLILVSQWVLLSGDWYCEQQRKAGLTNYDTIYKAHRMETRIDQARAWARDGAPKAKPAPGSSAGLTPDQWWDSTAGGKRARSEALAKFDMGKIAPGDMLADIAGREGAPPKAWLEDKVEEWKNQVREERRGGV